MDDDIKVHKSVKHYHDKQMAEMDEHANQILSFLTHHDVNASSMQIAWYWILAVIEVFTMVMPVLHSLSHGRIMLPSAAYEERLHGRGIFMFNGGKAEIMSNALDERYGEHAWVEETVARADASLTLKQAAWLGREDKRKFFANMVDVGSMVPIVKDMLTAMGEDADMKLDFMSFKPSGDGDNQVRIVITRHEVANAYWSTPHGGRLHTWFHEHAHDNIPSYTAFGTITDYFGKHVSISIS